MASIGGVSSSNTVSSLMNSANTISGLASGLDTESMIENLVKSYQTKIEQLNQKVVKTEWKQDAYRSIIQKMVGFSSKYASYTSSTNLMSPSFFNNAVKVLTKGEYQDSVSASGKTSSDISLNAVHQLAKAAQYRTKSNLVSGGASSDVAAILGKEADLSAGAEKNIELSNLSGSLTLTYGSKTISINFSETSTAKDLADVRNSLTQKGKSASDAEVLAEYINQKLGDEKIVFDSGASENASERIKATARSDGRIVFSELGTAKNGVYISGATGNLAKQLGLNEDDLKEAADKRITAINTRNIQGANGEAGLTRKLNAMEYLAEKSSEAGLAGLKMNISLNGSTKQVDLPQVRISGGSYYLNGSKVDEKDFADKYTEALNKSVGDAFKGKVKVENEGVDGKMKLKFTAGEGDELVVNTGVGEALGIGTSATSYLNTSKTLKDLMGDKLGGLEALKDKDGNDLLDDKGRKQYDFTINDVKIGTYTEDTKLSEILADINANKEAGVSVAYSQTTQSFTFTAKETGSDSQVKIEGGLAEAMFGSTDMGNPGSASFVKAFGVDHLAALDQDNNDDTIRVTFEFDGFTLATSFRPDETIDEVVDRLNQGSTFKNYKMTAAYNQYTGELEITDKSGAKVDFSAYVDTTLVGKVNLNLEDDYKPKIDYNPGQDAKFTVTVNGEQKTMTRSSNSVNLDGLTINMNEEFNGSYNADGTQNLDKAGNPVYKNSVTFQSKTDSEKIVTAIKDMVADYNSMMSEIKSAYATMPYQKSDGSFGNYEPLTDDERRSMSESEIQRYEEKAKQGLLFGDRDLSRLYSEMSEAFSFFNTADVDSLREMGITVGYDISTGAQTVQVDEEKLTAMLDSDPDRVADLFTKTDGIMDRMKTQLDSYAKTTGEPKGILVQKSGSPLSSLSLMNNLWQQEIDKYNTQIETWQDKLTRQVERYTSQFSRLEQLISQMNSQSSTLAGLMGGN